MNRKNVVIGVFVVGALALALLCIIILGGGKFFQSEVRYRSYFPQSVRGLSVGSPVMLQGVKIGNVVSISLVAFDSRGKRINSQEVIECADTINNMVDNWVTEVEYVIYPEKLGFTTSWYDFYTYGSKEHAVRRMFYAMVLTKGLRAQTQIASVLTGQLNINLAFFDDPVPFHKLRDIIASKEIPIYLSPMERLMRHISSKKSDDMLQQMMRGGQIIAKYIEDGRFEQLLKNINSVCENAKSVTGKMDECSSEVLGRLDDMLGECRNLAMAIRQQVERGSVMEQQVLETLRSLENVSNSINELSNRISDDPQSLIFGENQ